MLHTKFHDNGHWFGRRRFLKGLYLIWAWQTSWFCDLDPREEHRLIDCLCWGLTTRQPLWVILCRLPEKGRKETEEIAEEMKERDREERGTGMKVKKQKK